MAELKELMLIKKNYGERFARMCRRFFPTLLENEGVLLSILKNTFSENCKTLYEDITAKNLEEKFKNYIYSQTKIKEEIEELSDDKTPYELFELAGYDLFECKTEKEIQEFRKYYAKNEELCTFLGGRLRECIVFFAVKKNVDLIKRNDFQTPKREDEYGTSVMSIQFSKIGSCIVSIKNRYNHRVNNPDATYGNDLDRIVPGLKKSFEKLLFERGFKLNNNNVERFSMLNYVLAMDGRYYKYNMEVNGIYYCPGNIIIDYR